MIDSTVFRTLQKIGLTDKEAKVYFSALRLGPSVVLAISKDSGVKRSTVYSIIESLSKRGLMRKEIHGIKEYFVAAEPDKLERLLDEQTEALHSILPQLNALHHLKGSESVIKYYEGIESLKTVYLEILDMVRSREDYYVLSDSTKWYSLAPDFFSEFLERRSKLDIVVRHIFSASSLSATHVKGHRRMNEVYKFLPKKAEIATNLVVIPRRVFVHSLVPPIIGMVIENQALIQMHREMYNVMWNSLPEGHEPEP